MQLFDQKKWIEIVARLQFLIGSMRPRKKDISCKLCNYLIKKIWIEIVDISPVASNQVLSLS